MINKWKVFGLPVLAAYIAAAGIAMFAIALPVWAYVLVVPSNPAQQALSESVPTAIAPNSFQASDFQIDWLGKPIPGVEVSLGGRSLEWVRVAELLLVPRARLLVTMTGALSGQVTNDGFIQPMTVDKETGIARAEMPVALLGDDHNSIAVTIMRNGKIIRGFIRVRFAPKNPKPDEQLFLDASCSPYILRIFSEKGRPDEWGYVGCRMVTVEGAVSRTSSLEVYMIWEGTGQTIKINGLETKTASPPLWTFRLTPGAGTTTFESREHRITLSYFAPERVRLAFVGLGIGPYSYSLESQTQFTHTFAPVLTLYSSYAVTESIRAVIFDATAIHHDFYSDFGTYLNYESFKMLDRRVSVNFMLGGHLLWFQGDKSTVARFGAPQGIELIFRDALRRAHNLAVGAFVYPPIDGKAYYNAWLRWGSSGFFGEFNYIGWQERINESRVVSRSLGVSLGFPLFRLF